MAITDETLAAARAMKPAALQALLTAGYVPARRVAHALSGSDAVARAVAERLVRRSVRMLPKWRDPSTPENWFYHHAVLTTRGANTPPPDPHADPLVTLGPSNNPAYVAFVRALRLLPPQQREAFILHHGERLNQRLLGVAMDCSTQAADVHLGAAVNALSEVSGGRLAEFSGALTRAYANLQAAQPDPTPTINIHVRRVRRRVWARRVVRLAAWLIVLGGLAWAGWYFRDELRRLVRRASEPTTPQTLPTTAP